MNKLFKITTAILFITTLFLFVQNRKLNQDIEFLLEQNLDPINDSTQDCIASPTDSLILDLPVH